MKTDLAYEVLGGGESTVLFLHGIGNSRSFWRPFARRFEDSFRVILVDLPGFGDSPAIETEHLAEYAQPLIELLDTIEGPVTVVGHSLGGIAAVYSTNRTAAQIESLILVSASFRRLLDLVDDVCRQAIRSPGLSVATVAQLIGGTVPFSDRLIEVAVRNSYVRRATLWPFVTSDSDLDVEGLVAALKESGSTQTLKVLRFVEDFDIDRELEEMPHRLHQIVGDYDRLINRDDIKFYEPFAATTSIIPKCGHWPMFERAEDLEFYLRPLVSPK